MTQNFLEIENATFSASKKNKVNDVSLTIEKEGEIICLLGPSGVGKTTILRTIAGLQELQHGTIKLKGKIISSKDYNLEPEKRNIALCFQDNSLFPHYNVIDNINIGSKRNGSSKFHYRDEDLIKITRHFFKNNLPIASVCHGVEIPARADCVRGRRMATVPKAKFDLEVCGGTYVDEPCVIDGNLISGRTFWDHGYYMGEWMDLLNKERSRSTD